MKRPSRRQARVLLAFVAFGLVASALLALAVDRILHVDVEGVVALLRESGPFAPVVLVGLMMVAVVVPPVPSVPLDVAAGVAFGWAWGVAWVLVGAELGAVVAFLLARGLGRGWVERRVDPKALARVDEVVERRGFLGLLLMRLLPAFHFDWVSYAAGLTSMRLLPFAGATLLGMLPPVMAIVAVGDQLAERPTAAAAVFGGLLLLVVLPLGWWSLRPDASPAASGTDELGAWRRRAAPPMITDQGTGERP